MSLVTTVSVARKHPPRVWSAGNEVWFRIASEAIHRMREKTPRARGECLVDALITWMTPDRQLGAELNRFQVHVLGEGGYLWIERYGD